MNRTFFVVLIALSLAQFVTASTDVFEKTYLFNQQHTFWSWTKPDTTDTRELRYESGYMQFVGKQSGNVWALHNMPLMSHYIDSKFTCVIRKGMAGSGTGVLTKSGSNYQMFRVLSQGRYDIYNWNESSKVWRKIGADTIQGRINSPHFGSTTNEMVIRVRILDNVLTFFVDTNVVFQSKLSESVPEIGRRIDAIGVFVSGVAHVECREMYIKGKVDLPNIRTNVFSDVHKVYESNLNVGNDTRHAVISPNAEFICVSNTIKGVSDEILISKATSDTTWTVASPVGKPLNNKEPNNVISISQDGNELFVWGKYSKSGEWDGAGFSISRREMNGWGVPTSIELPSYKNRATSREECTSPDRKVVILACQTDDTHGEKDLYVSIRNTDGSYGPLKNLGPEVNTKGSENAPFLAADNRTLYYSSNSDGFGDNDVFVSKRLDDTWLRWTPRVNLGPNVNTPNWDTYFTIHPSGKYAYLNSTVNGRYGIYRLNLVRNAENADLLPDPVVIVKGSVRNSETGKPIATDIEYNDIRSRESLGSVQSEPMDGRYSIVLRGGRGYEFFAHAEGYFPVSGNVLIDSLQTYQIVKRDLLLAPIKKGAVIRLNNLFFDYDKYELKSESGPELDRLVQLMAKYPTMKLEIGGHTDDQGADKYNLTLSKNRAQSVAEYLRVQGVGAARMKPVGYGESKPLVRNTTEEARQENRRVEITILDLE